MTTTVTRKTAAKAARTAKAKRNPAIYTAGLHAADITWTKDPRVPKGPPNPAFPKGVTVDFRARGKGPGCLVKLDYPAKGRGFHYVRCRICGAQTSCRATGQSDDALQVVLPCGFANQRVI